MICNARPFEFPKDPDKARIGGVNNAPYDSRFFICEAAEVVGKQPAHYKGERVAYIVHAHCWVLLGQVLGKTPTQLAPIVQAFRRHWRSNKLRGLADDDIRIGEPSPKLKFGCDIYQNPLIIPVLQAVLTRAPTSHKIYPRFDRVPIEITIMISEWACPEEYAKEDVENMRNMLVAFHWVLPGWFWRKRLKEELFFELDPLRKSCSPVIWQILQLDLMGLVSDYTWYRFSGLANRERILENIFAVRRALKGA